MGNDATVRGNRASQGGKDLSGNRFSVLNWRVLDTAKPRSLLSVMPLNEFAHLIDGSNVVEITLPLGHSPGKQAMTAKDQSLCPWVILYRPFDQQRQLKPGA